MPLTSPKDATAQLADKPTHLPPRLPQQSPSISQARHLLLGPPRQMCKLLNAITPILSHVHLPTGLQQPPQPLVPHPSLSHPLPPSWSVAAKPPTTNCHHTPACFECGSQTPLQPLTSHPFYHTPMVRFLKCQNNHPLFITGMCCVSHPWSITHRVMGFFKRPKCYHLGCGVHPRIRYVSRPPCTSVI